MERNVVVAGVAAVSMIALGAWFARGQLGGKRTIRTPTQAVPRTPGESPAGDNGSGLERRIEGGEAPAWVRENPLEGIEDELVFTSHRSPEAASLAIDNDQSVLIEAAADAGGLEQVGYDTRVGLVDAWRDFVQPIVADDKEGFADAVAAFGGVTRFEDDEADGSPSDNLFDRVQPFFAGASIDLSHAKVRAADLSEPMAVPRLMKMPGMPEIGAGQVPMMAMATVKASGSRYRFRWRHSFHRCPLRLTGGRRWSKSGCRCVWRARRVRLRM